MASMNLLQQVQQHLGQQGNQRQSMTFGDMVNLVKSAGSPEKVDMVKDLAEAECYCMKAKYYDTVVEAMGKGSSGYQGQGGGTGSSAGYGGMQGYGSRDMQQPSGYGTRGGMGHADIMQPLQMAIQNAGPDEREHLRNEAKAILGMM